MAQATGGDEIWVSKGEYLPAAGGTFSVIPGVKFYGGFNGDESTPDQRPIHIPRGNDAEATILKGNGGRVINNDDNGLTGTDLLDRFTITGGAELKDISISRPQDFSSMEMMPM